MASKVWRGPRGGTETALQNEDEREGGGRGQPQPLKTKNLRIT